MPSINMIALRRAEKKRLERDVRRLMMIICIELIAGVVLTGFLYARICSTQARVGDLEVQLVRLQPDVKRIQMLEAKTKELEPKIVLLNDAKDRTMHWYSLLDKLSKSLPEKTWVRNIDSSDPIPDKNESEIVFSGVAENQKLVGDMMLRLYANPDLDNVGLRYTQTTSLGKHQMYEFQVAANLKTAKDEDKNKGVTPDGAQKS